MAFPKVEAWWYLRRLQRERYQEWQVAQFPNNARYLWPLTLGHGATRGRHAGFLQDALAEAGNTVDTAIQAVLERYWR